MLIYILSYCRVQNFSWVNSCWADGFHTCIRIVACKDLRQLQYVSELTPYLTWNEIIGHGHLAMPASPQSPRLSRPTMSIHPQLLLRWCSSSAIGPPSLLLCSLILGESPRHTCPRPICCMGQFVAPPGSQSMHWWVHSQQSCKTALEQVLLVNPRLFSELLGSTLLWTQVYWKMLDHFDHDHVKNCLESVFIAEVKMLNRMTEEKEKN